MRRIGILVFNNQNYRESMHLSAFSGQFDDPRARRFAPNPPCHLPRLGIALAVGDGPVRGRARHRRARCVARSRASLRQRGAEGDTRKGRGGRREVLDEKQLQFFLRINIISLTFPTAPSSVPCPQSATACWSLTARPPGAPSSSAPPTTQSPPGGPTSGRGTHTQRG